MKTLQSLIIVIFLLMVCVASIRQAQSRNDDGFAGITGSNKQFGLTQPMTTVTEKERQQYQRRIGKSLAEFGGRLKIVDTESARRGETTGRALRGAIREFENKLTAAQEEFKKVRSARAEAWEGLKPKMDAAMADLSSSYDRAIAQAKRST